MSLLGKALGTSGGRVKDFNGPAGGGSSSYLWGMSSLAGEMVSPATAAQVAAVFCAIKIISETMGMISLDMYERRGNDSIYKLPKHPLQFRLHDEPNDDQTAMEWRSQNTAALALWGNTYNKKVLRGSRLAALKFLAPQATTQQYIGTAQRSYKYFPLDGWHSPEVLSPAEVLHPKTLSLGSSFEGTSPVSMVRNAFGLALALEKHSSKFFANGAIPGGVLSYPGTLNDDLIRNIRESWRKLYGGGDNSHQIAVLEQEVKYQAIGSDPEKTQLVEARKFQVLEVSRVWRIPPHMLYASNSGSAMASIEQQSIEFVRYTLRPWIVLWEQALNRSLLSPEEKGKVFCAFDVSDLEYGDMKSRFDAHAVAINGGWESPNDVLRAEGKNPREDPEGDAYLQPMNMLAFGEDLPNPRTMMPVPRGSVLPGPQAPNRGGVPAVGTGGGSTARPGSSAKATHREREIFEVAQDIISKAKSVGKLIEKELSAI